MAGQRLQGPMYGVSVEAVTPMVQIRIARAAQYFKHEVGYEHPAKGKDHCGECKHYYDHRCDIVRGPIQPEDWCRKFARKGT